MSWVDQTLADIGRSMGIDGLAFTDEGSISMTFDVMGTLYFERLEDSVLMYLMREMHRSDPDIMIRALDNCHWRHRHPFEVNVGLHGDRRLAFAVRISDEEFVVPTVERAIDFLNRLHEDALEGIH